MKKILLLAAAAIMAAGAMQAKTADEVRIYLNPGHGSWGPNDRPMATIPYPNLANGMPDTCGFYESNTNLWKILKMGETLEKMGVKITDKEDPDLTAAASFSIVSCLNVPPFLSAILLSLANVFS